MAAAPPAPPATPPIQIQAAPQIKSGLPNGSGVVSVPGAAIDPGPREPAKPGSARAKMMEGLGKIAKQDPAASPEPPAPPKPAPPKAAPQPDPDPGDDDAPPVEPAPESSAEPKADDAAAPAAVDPKTGKPPKANPWKLFEAEKQARAKAEKELQDVKKSIVPEAERKALTERVEKAEARAKELEEHIRFVDYEKSSEFVEKYDKPYKNAWNRAMSELKELTVDTGQGARPITSEDMLELVNMSLPQAIQTAKQVFGDAAEYVLNHRKEIRSLFDAQAQALTEAKKNGVEHHTKQKEAYQKWSTETEGHIKTTWDTVNSSVLADEKNGHYFKPRDGDEEWNQRLTKGYEMVDRGFNENPRDPKLTSEQREAIVKRHAAIRNRAAGWGPLKHRVEKLEAELAEARKVIDGYKGTEPPAGGQAPPPTNGSQPTTARARMHADLVKLAKPV